MIPSNPRTALIVGVIIGLVVVPAAARVVARRRPAASR